MADEQVAEKIKDVERDAWGRAGGEAGALDAEHGQSDLEDGAECEPDDDFFTRTRRPARRPKRPRTEQKHAVAAQNAAADETTSTDDAADATAPGPSAPVAEPPQSAPGAAQPPYAAATEGSCLHCPIVLD